MREGKPLGLILIFIILSLVGQYLFKAAMNSDYSQQLVAQLSVNFAQIISGQVGLIWQATWDTVLLMFQILVFAGLFCYALSTVCWLAILSKTDLSFAYPMISIGYIAILLMGWLVFGEQVTLLRWLGVILISIGIVGIYSEGRFLHWGYGFAGLIFILALALASTSHNIPQLESFEKPIGLLLLSIPMGIIGQILFKAGMNKDINKQRVKTIGASVGEMKSGNISAAMPALWQSIMLFFSGFVFAGLVVYGLSTVVWLLLLAKVPLSFLYPMLSIGYVIILFMGWLLFKERVTVVRWYGVILICYGIITIYSEDLIYAYLMPFAAALAALALFLAFVAYKPNLFSLEDECNNSEA